MAATPEDSNAPGDLDEIQRLAREYQYDRYLAALLAPRRHREALTVLAAFAGELQRIPFLVSEPMMAAIRLQWWRDELAVAAPDASAGNERRTGHPLCDALSDVARTYRLPLGLLQGMIDAAEAELDATPFAEEAEIRQVLTKFHGAMFELAGRVLGAEAPRETWIAAGVAYGAAQWAAEAEWRRAHGLQTYLSRDLGSQEPSKAFSEMARKALGELRDGTARDHPLRTTLLPIAVLPPLLRAVDKSHVRSAQRVGQQVDVTIVELSEFSRARSLLWAHWRGRI